jgi:hypothetical protein
MNRGSTAEYLKPAEGLLERALALDPNNVDALAAKGWVDMDLGAGFMTDDHAAPPGVGGSDSYQGADAGAQPRLGASRAWLVL